MWDWDNVTKPACVSGEDKSRNLEVSEVQAIEHDGAIWIDRGFVDRFKDNQVLELRFYLMLITKITQKSQTRVDLDSWKYLE